MILHKLIVTASLMMISALASTCFAAGDSSQDLTIPVWSSDIQSSASFPGTISQFSLGQGWLNNKWSGQNSLYQTNNLDKDTADTSQWTIDFKRRLLSATENTYLAMGLGWNDIEIMEGESSSGMRFVAEGRVGIYGPAYLFGQAALSPWMTDFRNNIDPFGKELELGLAVNPLPAMSFKAGYRSYWLDSSDSSVEPTLQRQTDGFYIGGGLHW
jgi:hypothetical protein